MTSHVYRHRLLLSLIVTTTLTACGGGQEDAPASTESPAADMQEEAAGMAESMAEDAGEIADEAEAMVESMAEEAEDAMDAAEEAMDSAAADVASAVSDDGDPCTLSVTVGDSIAFSTNALSVPSSCDTVTVSLTHTGRLPAAAMGHNWVLVPADAVNAVGSAGINAGLEGNYLPAGDDRIVAATKIIGGGQSDSTSFSLSDLADGTDYVYICTFPGHWSVMKGTFTVGG